MLPLLQALILAGITAQHPCERIVPIAPVSPLGQTTVGFCVAPMLIGSTYWSVTYCRVSVDGALKWDGIIQPMARRLTDQGWDYFESGAFPGPPEGVHRIAVACGLGYTGYPNDYFMIGTEVAQVFGSSSSSGLSPLGRLRFAR